MQNGFHKNMCWVGLGSGGQVGWLNEKAVTTDHPFKHLQTFFLDVSGPFDLCNRIMIECPAEFERFAFIK